MIVCVCKFVTEEDIIDAVDNGHTNFADVQKKLNVSTSCGICQCEIKQLIQKRQEQNLLQKTSSQNTFKNQQVEFQSQ